MNKRPFQDHLEVISLTLQWTNHTEFRALPYNIDKDHIKRSTVIRMQTTLYTRQAHMQIMHGTCCFEFSDIKCLVQFLP